MSRDATQFKADRIASELGLGGYQSTGGGDGSMWRQRRPGHRRRRRAGRIRWVRVGGSPWTEGATFIGEKAVDASIDNHLGANVGSAKVGENLAHTFAHGSVIVDAKGNVIRTQAQ